ncbi:LytR/AlgR family response regulator transcription factor [Nitrincola sp. MINF-07-Sa-05]|uniref:LytR/AlgR family response regulator transcription factor n=1 Tax=Nitrincola salilacus TaxID=3400273 RepID=UPI003917FA12
MRVLIVDDEPLARSRMQRLLEQQDGYSCIGTACNGLQALEMITTLQPDLVLLDIEMPGMSGLDVAEQLPPLPPAIIFVTAHPEHALNAYRVGPADYLLKPVSAERLQESLARLGTQTRAHLEKNDQQAPWICYQMSGNHRRIRLSQSFYFMADGKYVRMVFEGGEALLECSLRQLEESYPDQLLRIHRNALVNRQRLRGIIAQGDGQHLVEIDGCKDRLAVSRRMSSRIKAQLTEP